MNNKSLLMAGLLVTASVVFIPACTQMPTEKQSITDLRPQISFKVLDDTLMGATIYIDGVDSGLVSQYLDGSGALRIRPGTHLINVNYGSRVLLEERFYLGDGVSKTFLIK